MCENIYEGTTIMANTPSKIGFTFAVSALALSFSGVATAYEVEAQRGAVDHQFAAFSPSDALIPSVSLMQTSTRATNYSPLLGANASYGVAAEGAAAGDVEGVEGTAASGGGSGVIIAGLAAVLVVVATVSATSGDSVSA